MTDKEKIIEYLKYKGVSKNKFYTATGLSTGFLDKGSSLGVDKLRIIIDNYPDFNPDWLLAENGNMLKIDRNKLISIAENNKIPLIPLDAMAGFGTGSMQVMDYDTKTYIIPEFDELNVDFMIRVKGSSMYPKYNSGDIVGCKKLPLDTFFQWNKVYVLDTSQGAMIKRIHKSDKEGFLLLVSDNEKYRPFDIPIDDVYSLSIVMGVIRLE
jgi:phage repressor protein C with HTH and peptisase S24 domain